MIYGHPLQVYMHIMAPLMSGLILTKRDFALSIKFAHQLYHRSI